MGKVKLLGSWDQSVGWPAREKWMRNPPRVSLCFIELSFISCHFVPHPFPKIHPNPALRLPPHAPMRASSALLKYCISTPSARTGLILLLRSATTPRLTSTFRKRPSHSSAISAFVLSRALRTPVIEVEAGLLEERGLREEAVVETEEESWEAERRPREVRLLSLSVTLSLSLSLVS